MKEQEEKDRQKIIDDLKDISPLSGVIALNTLLNGGGELSQSTKTYCRKFLIQENIAFVYIVNRGIAVTEQNRGGVVFVQKALDANKNYFYYKNAELFLCLDSEQIDNLKKKLNEINLIPIYIQ